MGLLYYIPSSPFSASHSRSYHNVTASCVCLPKRGRDKATFDLCGSAKVDTKRWTPPKNKNKERRGSGHRDPRRGRQGSLFQTFKRTKSEDRQRLPKKNSDLPDRDSFSDRITTTPPHTRLMPSGRWEINQVP
ncbi:hypothetical protein B0H19DRAFT_413825 [Mycena capillaripes]|nr:hypothetical protein B0H19DRAFT_413825 [Mycena capillaripes]